MVLAPTAEEYEQAHAALVPLVMCLPAQPHNAPVVRAADAEQDAGVLDTAVAAGVVLGWVGVAGVFAALLVAAAAVMAAGVLGAAVVAGVAAGA